MSVPRLRIERTILTIFGGFLVAFLTVPIFALFVTATSADLKQGFQNPLIWPALRLSLLTTLASLILVVTFGTPLAWTLAHARGRLARAVETAVHLPIVIPPAVAGIALLFAFGRRGLLAGWIYPEGWSVTFTTMAVVLAETFVSAPFFVQAAISAFRRVDTQIIWVARTFGASPLRVFFRVALPIAMPGLVAGGAMSWARALGEFGATLMFAGNLQGKTQTLPLAIYTALESDLRAAQALSIVLVMAAFVFLLFVRAVLRRSVEHREVFP